MYLINFLDIIKEGYKSEWIFVLSMLCLFLAICTIAAKNPVSSILFLIVLYVFISLYLIISDISFIGISYLLVYVGAISILFLFILMLINVRVSELHTEGKNSSVLAIFVVLGFVFAFSDKLPYFISILSINISNNILITSNIESLDNLNISTVSSNNWDDYLIEITHIASIGNILYTAFFIFMLILGSILLLAMVGAIVITVAWSNELKNKDFFNY